MSLGRNRSTQNFTVCPVDRCLGKPFASSLCTVWFAESFATDCPTYSL